jgi:hypothetical protein
MQARSSSHLLTDRRKRRRSRSRRWLARNAPYIFLYVVGALVAIAITYYLVEDAERSAATHGVGLLRDDGRARSLWEDRVPYRPRAETRSIPTCGRLRTPAGERSHTDEAHGS